MIKSGIGSQVGALLAPASVRRPVGGAGFGKNPMDAVAF